MRGAPIDGYRGTGICVSLLDIPADFPASHLCPVRFAFEGIGQLLEHLLISEAKRIRLANANGVRKMIRNILALQQSIKTLTSDTRGADFDRAKKYYTLFFKTPTV